MSLRWKWLLLVPLLSLGSPVTRVSTPVLVQPATLASIVAIPKADETRCSFIKGKGNADGAWANAPLVDGKRIPDTAALARLRGRPVIVYGANFAGQHLVGLRLAGICFEQSNFSRADFRGAVMDDAAFEQSDLSDAVMANTRLRRARFEDSQLDNVDAAGADLSEAKIEGGSFDGLLLRDADMTGFDLYCGLINGDRTCAWPDNRGVDARGANLSRAHLNLYLTNDWKFEGARLDRTVIQFLQMSSFQKADVRGPIILESSGYQSARVRLSAAEWIALQANDWQVQPSFDCRRARTIAEHSVCASQYVQAKDRRLERIYRDALASGVTSITNQRRWLAERDRCNVRPDTVSEREYCLADAYDARTNELIRALPQPAWLKPGARQFFISTDLAPPERFQRSALYPRIFPVLVTTANSRLLVRVIANNRIKAGADAYGSNGHSCSLGGPVLELNRSTGWFGAPHTKSWLDNGSNSDKREDLLLFSGHEVDVWPTEGEGVFGEYASCGARAGFDDMTRVEVPSAHRRLIDKLGRELLANI